MLMMHVWSVRISSDAQYIPGKCDYVYLTGHTGHMVTNNDSRSLVTDPV